MPFPKMTWAGLLITTLGWGFILSYPLILPFVPDAGHAAGPSDSVRFVPILGENAVMTGLAIAVLGALEKMLELLGKIAGNSASAARSQARASTQLAASSNTSTASAMSSAMSLAAAPTSAPVSPGIGQTPMLMPQRTPSEVVTRGALNGRDYVLFRDGSVVVETLLGPRRFGSITEAQEFIGAS
jgi:hypothetical protein